MSKKRKKYSFGIYNSGIIILCCILDLPVLMSFYYGLL